MFSLLESSGFPDIRFAPNISWFKKCNFCVKEIAFREVKRLVWRSCEPGRSNVETRQPQESSGRRLGPVGMKSSDFI